MKLTCQFLTCLWIVILLGLPSGSCDSTPYCIRSTDGDEFLEDLPPCQSLSDFSANLTAKANMTLIMLPGDHRLATNLSLSNINTFEMTSQSVNSTVTVHCGSSQISFESIKVVSISGVNFVGCGNNLVSNVGSFIVEDSTFEGQHEAGTSLSLINTTAEIIDCLFKNNGLGTLMESLESLRQIADDIGWLIVRNVTGVVRVGGALMISTFSNVTINGSTFENNIAGDIGGDIYVEQGSVMIFNSTFLGDGPQTVDQEIAMGGGVFVHQSNMTIADCEFRYKHATVGASVMSSVANITIKGSRFDFNSATDHAGGVFAYNSSLYVDNCTFHNNTALGGAGITTELGTIVVTKTIFTFNSVWQHGGALDIGMDIATISACYFEGNIAHSFAGALLLWGSTGEIYGSDSQECSQNCSAAPQENTSPSLMLATHFVSNTAPTGAALYLIKSTIRSCGPIIVEKNHAQLSSSVYFLNSNWQFQGLIKLTQNQGSFLAHKSNITISGCSIFTNNSPPKNTTASFKEGGALTLYQTALDIRGQAMFENNSAEIGGAIVAIESELFLNDEVHVRNNNALVSGGGMYVSQSQLTSQLESSVYVTNNNAIQNGGGLHAVSSLIYIVVTGSRYTDVDGQQFEDYRGGAMYITDNSAQNGGGVYVEANSKISILKDYVFSTNVGRKALNFERNLAQYGGAIYVDDATNSGTCASNPFEINSPKSECFLSVVSTETIVTTNTDFSLSNIQFDANTANVSGDTLFGGLLDRCIVSPFNEVDRTIDRSTNQLLSYNGNGIEYLTNISNVNIDSISSFPTRVCPCVNGQQNCSYDIRINVDVRKGELFNLSIIAVDHVDRPVNATVQGRLSSVNSNLLFGQVTKISDKCTNVTFRIASPHLYERLSLFASDGPCEDAELSTLNVRIDFLPCTCPIGFEPLGEHENVTCSCVCNTRLLPYVTDCDIGVQSIVRTENIWISYVNDTNSSGYVTHRYCPFDYCIPEVSQPINLNLDEGSDIQCALNRTGILCGACKPGLSLSLGSSKCLQCPSYWWAHTVIITVLSIFAGIGMVVIFLWLNITVAVGTLNGLLFYANIVSANRVVLLPYPEPNFITVFISWLNLELGIDVCFFEGMDIYMRTWLQLAFPIYIIILVILLIVISRYSTRFSRLISKRNPVATLATLILISYGKLFDVVLLAQPFSFAPLDYPDGTTRLVWLPDGTVEYLKGKHFVLFIAALLILALCVAYSFLLLFWQLILRTPDWKILKCIKSPTLTLFLEAYHVPYTAKHRYWPGLLLLVRAIIYLVATFNVSGNPQIQLISVIFIMSCVTLLKLLITTKIFKRWSIDSLESFFFFNILFLASSTAYNLSTGNSQDGVAYTSVVLSILVTVIILLYHIYEYTPIFSVVKNMTIVSAIKNKFKSKPETSAPPLDTGYFNHLFRDGDISLDADYHIVSTNNTPGQSSKERARRQPTASVVEID